MTPVSQEVAACCSALSDPGDRLQGCGEQEDKRVFVTCSGARFRCAAQKVDKLFCSVSDRGYYHIMEGNPRVLHERIMTLRQQDETYITKTNQGQYADLQCLQKTGKIAKDEYPLPVGAFQKNLECEYITVACARSVNGRPCGKVLPLAQLPGHLKSDCDPAGNMPAAAAIPDAGVHFVDSTSDSDHLNDDRFVEGLLADFEVFQLNQAIRNQEATLLEDRPENNRAIALQIALVCDSEPCSDNGVLHWDLSEYSKWKQKADSGELTMLASPPFYSKTGYKLCAKVYLAGDNSGEKGRFSIGVAIMQSDHDDYLAWPFREKVTISLLDQSVWKDGDHITRVVFGRDSPNCEQPESVMNFGLGFPDFLEGESIDRFIGDDSLIIQVSVEPVPERKFIRARRRSATPGYGLTPTCPGLHQ